MVEIVLNGQTIRVPEGITLIQAFEIAGDQIPRFCYHDRLKIAGNCRMCLVEVENPRSSKPVASCATNVSPGMIVRSDTEMVKKAREGVMEFLLANHPLDCPICDQGGECDLQDQAYVYGKGTGSFNEEKRSVIDKNMGPLIQTNMTRCIHCTRCVRFMEDIAGTRELGTFGRGEDMEISTFLEKNIESELSGNIVDLCPVGALTAKPCAFSFRSWELEHTDSIDILDAACSNIRIDSRGMEVMRILPRCNEEINQEWIGDKTRFAIDGLKMQRIDRSYMKKNGKICEASYDDAINLVAKKITTLEFSQIGCLIGDLADVQTAYVAKVLMDKIGSTSYECRQDGAMIDTSSRGNYIFNTSIARIEEATDILLIGTNPRWESPTINLRIHNAVKSRDAKVANIGFQSNLNYNVDHIGSDASSLVDILSGKHKYSAILEKSERPAIILGQDAINGEYGDIVMNTVLQMVKNYQIDRRDNWNGYNMLHKVAGRVGALDVGFIGNKSRTIRDILNDCSDGKIKLLIVVGADEIQDLDKLKDTFVVYIGTHGDRVANIADVILPSSCYTEKSAFYANTEGRYQSTLQAVNTIGESKEDVEIFFDISRSSGIDLGFRDYNSMIQCLTRDVPEVNNCFDRVISGDVKSNSDDQYRDKVLYGIEFKSTMKNFYMTDYISRSSKTMSICSQALLDA